MELMVMASFYNIQIYAPDCVGGCSILDECNMYENSPMRLLCVKRICVVPRRVRVRVALTNLGELA